MLKITLIDYIRLNQAISDIPKKLTSSKEYLDKYEKIVDSGNNSNNIFTISCTISQIFAVLEQDLGTIRETECIRTEREKITWKDPEEHFKQVQREELAELKMKFVHSYYLFILAGKKSLEPIMKRYFNKMIKNLSDIREITGFREERAKKEWKDSRAHYNQATIEESQEAQLESYDLKLLYYIALRASYEEGIELISNMLKKVPWNANDIKDERRMRN